MKATLCIRKGTDDNHQFWKMYVGMAFVRNAADLEFNRKAVASGNKTVATDE